MENEIKANENGNGNVGKHICMHEKWRGKTLKLKFSLVRFDFSKEILCILSPFQTSQTYILSKVRCNDH